METELGSIFDKPDGFSYSEFGAYIGAGQYSTNLNADAVKGHYGQFNHFGPGSAAWGFPYTALRQYEAQEVAAGRPPIFVTATYQGKKRPVLYGTYLNLDSNRRPTAPMSDWNYVVNTRDVRFIKFWINRYARPVIFEPMHSMKNVWSYVDGCAFNYGAYGVLDDNNQFVSGVRWDAPFPQNPNDYLSSIATFFSVLKEIAPDINVNTDTGSMSDPTQFPTVYANIPGATAEEIYYNWHSNPSSSVLTGYYWLFGWYSWLGSHGRLGILGAFLPGDYENGDLRSAFVVYELLKGPNFFFAPRAVQCPHPVCPMEPPPSEWLGWKAKLGNPVSTFQSKQEPGGGLPNRLFWRQYSTGYVYLNWTGHTQVVGLPAGKWVDLNNKPVTSLQIPNLTGTFVTAAGEPTTAAEPSISPRSPFAMTGPVTVTIENNTPGATIHYTVDGKTPEASSPIYTGSFQLHSSAVVQARAFISGENPSAPSIASYRIISGPPSVQFSLASDSGPAGSTICYPVLALSAVPDETVAVTYTVQSPQGKSVSGSTSFLPGEVYRQFPVQLSSPGKWRIVLNQVTGALPGTTKAFEYTAE